MPAVARRGRGPSSPPLSPPSLPLSLPPALLPLSPPLSPPNSPPLSLTQKPLCAQQTAPRPPQTAWPWPGTPPAGALGNTCGGRCTGLPRSAMLAVEGLRGFTVLLANGHRCCARFGWLPTVRCAAGPAAPGVARQGGRWRARLGPCSILTTCMPRRQPFQLSNYPSPTVPFPTPPPTTNQSVRGVSS